MINSVAPSMPNCLVSNCTRWHSAAAVMLANGVPLKVVSEVLGHASIGITGDISGHVAPDVSREALRGCPRRLDDKGCAKRCANRRAQHRRPARTSDRAPITRGFTRGSKQTRTADPFLVREVLYQLSYAPGWLPCVCSRQD
jgi:hypothetical protein